MKNSQSGTVERLSYHSSLPGMSLQRMLESIFAPYKTRLDASLRWHDRQKETAKILFSTSTVPVGYQIRSFEDLRQK